MQPDDQGGATPPSPTGEALKDLIFGCALLGAGVFALVWIKLTPAGFGAPTSALDHASVPILCSALLIGLSALYTAGALARLVVLARAERRAPPSIQGWRPSLVAWRRLATVAALVGYVYALQALPFFAATAALLAVMFVVYGHRSPAKVATVALVGAAALTGLFVHALRLPI